MSGTKVRSGDVLLNITGASLGRTCAVPTYLKEANVNQHVCIIRPLSRRCDSEYLAIFLSTTAAQTAIYISQNGSSREGLAVSAVKAIAMTLPPISEQRAITQKISSETSGIQTAIARTENEIALLREYRTCLVTDVVTGQLDVREAAQHLPAEAKEAEPILDGDEIEDEAELDGAETDNE